MPGRLAAARRALRHGGLDAIKEFVSRGYLAARPSSPADPVLEADWDLLVVLDACRADLFAEVVEIGDYDRIHAGETRQSPASATNEWLEVLFDGADDAVLSSLTYVSGNPYTEQVLDADRFAMVDDVWSYAWDDDLGTIPPERITDRAIAVGREHDPERTIVHYMQPHFPSLAEESEGVALDAFGDEQIPVWNELRFGQRTEAEVWESYRRNLEIVLAEVESLLANFDAERAVVTADHGNAFGEYNIYGHPKRVDIPCLREVPWCVTEAVDEGTRDPASYDRSPDEGEDVVEERLRSLGYT
jgi:hypothetical protein